MRLSISRAAEDDLRDIFLYGSKVYGVAAARAYLESILLAVDRVAEWPLAARLRDEVRPPVRLFPHWAHNIFYDFDADHVNVVRILHHSADWINLL